MAHPIMVQLKGTLKDTSNVVPSFYFLQNDWYRCAHCKPYQTTSVGSIAKNVLLAKFKSMLNIVLYHICLHLGMNNSHFHSDCFIRSECRILQR